MGAVYNPLAKAGFSQSTIQNYDALLSDGTGVVTRGGTMATVAAVIKRGTICKLDAATAVVAVAAVAADCNCIMAEDVDVSGTAVNVIVYVAGKFKADAMIWPAVAHGPCADNLRDFGILVESVVARDGLMVKANPDAAMEQAAKERIEANRADRKEADKATAESLPIGTAESSLTYLKPEDREKEATQHLTDPRPESKDDKDAPKHAGHHQKSGEEHKK